MNQTKCMVMIDELQTELSNVARVGASDPIINDSLRALEVLKIELEGLQESKPIDPIDNRFDELEKKVILWAEERGIFASSNKTSQFLKTMSEAGELADHLSKDAPTEELVDDIGDMLVTMIIMSEFIGVSLVDCLDYAYDEIKNRKGKMVGGVFVKECDNDE